MKNNNFITREELSFISQNYYKFICFNQKTYNYYKNYNNNLLGLLSLKEENKLKAEQKKIEEKLKNIIQNSSINKDFTDFTKEANKFITNIKNKKNINKNKLNKLEIEEFLKIFKQKNLYTNEELQKITDKFYSNVYKDKKNLIEGLSGQISNYSGVITEQIITNILNREASKILNYTAKTFYTGAIEYGKNFKELERNFKENTVKDFKTKETLTIYNSKEIKIDAFTELKKNDKNISSLSFGIKSHWVNKGNRSSKSSIQSSEKSLKDVISLYNFYLQKQKIQRPISRQNNSYWSYINAFHYRDQQDNQNEINKRLIYGAYFGDVDFMIDFVVINEELKIELLSKFDIIEMLKVPKIKSNKNMNNIDFYFYKSSKENNIIETNKDIISQNEDLILNNYKFSSLSLNLFALAKRRRK